MRTHMSSHSHSHPNHDSSRRMGWAFFLNVGFTIIEFIGGWLTNSTAIMADAVHDLGDSLSIGTAWCLNIMGAKQASQRFTYGYKRLSLLGALINALVMIGGSTWVMLEAIPRLFDPPMPHSEGMLGLALLGITVNAYAAFKLSEGKSLNERVLSWHMIEDVLGWLAVLIVAIVLMFFHWPILDPLLSIAFTLFILFNVLLNLRETIGLFLQATPDEQMQQNIRKNLLSLGQISGLHHLHFWSLDGEHHVLTVHLVLKNMLTSAQLTDLKMQIAKQLVEYELAHTTIEFEFPDEACRDE